MQLIMDKVEISVITTLYKGTKYLNNLIRMLETNAKVFANTYSDLKIEYVVVNDYPEDTIENVTKYESNLIITVIDDKINAGIHGARIKGLGNSKGKYVVFLDQDDEIMDNFLIDQYRKMGNADLIVANGYKETEKGQKIIYRDPIKHILVKNEMIYLLAANQIVSPGQCLIRKQAIPKDWTENIMKYNGSDDLYLWILMLESKSKIALNKNCLYIHKKSGSNLSENLYKMEQSSQEMLSFLEKSFVSKRNLRRRKRLEEYVLNVQAGRHTGLKKICDCLINIDISVVKLFAYFI